MPHLDFTVCVDRSVAPSYPPSYVPMHPELRAMGPASYNMRIDVRRWFHEGQMPEVRIIGSSEDQSSENKTTNGFNVYMVLKEKGILPSCLNLQDGDAIQQKGVLSFRRLFNGEKLPLWGSVVKIQNAEARKKGKCVHVPCLEDNGEIVVHWVWLGDIIGVNSPALHFINIPGCRV